MSVEWVVSNPLGLLDSVRGFPIEESHYRFAVISAARFIRASYWAGEEHS